MRTNRAPGLTGKGRALSLDVWDVGFRSQGLGFSGWWLEI